MVIDIRRHKCTEWNMDVIETRYREIERASSGTSAKSDRFHTFEHFVLVADGHNEESRATVFAVDYEPGHNQSDLRDTEGWGGSRHEPICNSLQGRSCLKEGTYLHASSRGVLIMKPSGVFVAVVSMLKASRPWPLSVRR